MRAGAAAAVLLLVTTAGCSSPAREKESRQKDLKEFSARPDVRAKIADARTKSQMRQRSPAMKALYDINGRWRSDVVESDRRLELSFGMDGVVVVSLVSPLGSLAYSQGKFTYDPVRGLKVVLASPPAPLKPYSSFAVRSTGAGNLLVIDGREVKIFHA